MRFSGLMAGAVPGGAPPFFCCGVRVSRRWWGGLYRMEGTVTPADLSAWANCPNRAGGDTRASCAGVRRRGRASARACR